MGVHGKFAGRVPVLDLDLLQSFSAIADSGNFSAAAEMVGRTPSAVSMQVKRMEEVVGRALFHRDSRSVTLTTDGELLLPHARRMLALNREMMAKFMTPDVTGLVRLGAPDDTAERHLPEMLRRFSQTHPGVTVDVVVGNSSNLREMVKRREIDISLVTCSLPLRPGGPEEVLLVEKLVWAMLKNGVCVERRPIPISVWEEGCAWRNAGIAGLNDANVDHRIAFQSANISGQKAAILADLAIAPIPLTSLQGDVIAVPKSYGLPELPEYSLAMLVAEDVGEPVRAAADHLRSSYATCCTD